MYVWYAQWMERMGDIFLVSILVSVQLRPIVWGIGRHHGIGLTILRISAYQGVLFKTDVMDDLFNYFNPATQAVSPMISADTYELIMKNADRLNSAIIYDRDYAYNYFGFKVLTDIISIPGSNSNIIPHEFWRLNKL